MKVISTQYPDRETWLANRQHGIGASEAGAVCGVGFKTPIQLWREKLGLEKPADLSENNRVQFGNDAEEPLRALFRVMYPQYELTFTPYTVLSRDDNDFMYCTPDGWLTDISTGKKGLYESKTTTCLSKADYERWNEQIPMGYYCQILHSMYVGGFDFAVVFALLRDRNGDADIRSYRFDRVDCEADIAWVVEKETEFWKRVKTGTIPSATLTL